MVVEGELLRALRAGPMGPFLVFQPDIHLLPLLVEVHARHSPGSGQAQESSIEVHVVHVGHPRTERPPTSRGYPRRTRKNQIIQDVRNIVLSRLRVCNEPIARQDLMPPQRPAKSINELSPGDVWGRPGALDRESPERGDVVRKDGRDLGKYDSGQSQSSLPGGPPDSERSSAPSPATSSPGLRASAGRSGSRA
jgi:hypothetical protein